MDKIDRELLKEDIADIKSLNRNEFWLILKYCLEAYIKSLVIFGANSKVTQDTLSVLKEYMNINSERRKIMKFLLQNSFHIGHEEADDLLIALENINEQTVIYYYRVLDDIIDACECKNEVRAIRIKKDFDTLIETDDYRAKAVGLVMTLEDIKSFFDYPDVFWQYVEKKVTYVDSHIPDREKFYSTLMRFDSNDCLIDIKVIVPYIIDLKTALVNVHEFKHAYDLYNLLGCQINERDSVYEQMAQDAEKSFVKEYALKRFKSKK